jgi:PAS domain S-box-containing protein
MAENFPLTLLGSRDWVTTYGKVAATCKPILFDACSPTKENYYQVYAYSVMKGYCVSVFIDVTAQKNKVDDELSDRRKTEQQLISAEKRFRRLYETTQDGIMARDLEGRMLHCNPAYAKMLGYKRKELRLLSVKQLMPERWHTQRDRIAQKVLKAGRSIVFEREYTRKDGSIFPASVRTWRLTDGRGKVIGIWSIVRDISQQKKLQKNLEKQAGALEKIVVDRTKQLKDSERLVAIGQTAGMVGHDLRNPLQTMTGELYLAKAEVETLLDSEVKRNLQESIQVIEEQAAYMDKIVSDLQAFVQPVRIEKRPIYLKELISNVLRTISIPPNISVKTQSQRTLPQVKVDANLLKRVLINLVTNAVQAMPNGGKLNINSHVNSGQVCISVKDTGVGIADSIKSQIFTPLFTTKPRGQGFGLAVCKRVIEAHGGNITFKSTAGKGTKFTIEFPIT